MASRFDPSRRQFLRTLARWAAAPAMVGALSAMTRRKGETCINDTICRTCGIAETCGLPQALSFRDAIGREEHDGR
jgi:hypothetical protein